MSDDVIEVQTPTGRHAYANAASYVVLPDGILAVKAADSARFIAHYAAGEWRSVKLVEPEPSQSSEATAPDVSSHVGVAEDLDALRTDLWRTMNALDELVQALVLSSRVDVDSLRRVDEQLRRGHVFDLPPFGLTPDYARGGPKRWEKFADRRPSSTSATVSLYFRRSRAARERT